MGPPDQDFHFVSDLEELIRHYHEGFKDSLADVEMDRRLFGLLELLIEARRRLSKDVAWVKRPAACAKLKKLARQIREASLELIEFMRKQSWAKPKYDNAVLPHIPASAITSIEISVQRALFKKFQDLGGGIGFSDFVDTLGNPTVSSPTSSPNSRRYEPSTYNARRGRDDEKD